MCREERDQGLLFLHINSWGGREISQDKDRRGRSHLQQIPRSRAQILAFTIQLGSHGCSGRPGASEGNTTEMGSSTGSEQLAASGNPMALLCELEKDALSWQTWPCSAWISFPHHVRDCYCNIEELELLSAAACQTETGEAATL